jgi:hypothetical protein
MFKELMASLDRNCDHAKLEKYKDKFEQMIACEKAEATLKVRKKGRSEVGVASGVGSGVVSKVSLRGRFGVGSGIGETLA